MAELTPKDEKLGEVLGLAMAAQTATDSIAKLVEDNDEVRSLLERMHREAGETRERCESALDAFEGKKTAIQDKARETRQEAEEMMKTYLGDDADELDGFEFLIMAEAGELGHWEILRVIGETEGDATIRELTEFAIPVQQRHEKDVRSTALELAREEAGG
jgi:hypothetical protein